MATSVTSAQKSNKRARRQSGGPKKKMSDNLKALFFLFPTWILLLIFFITPMVLTFYFAFTNLALTGAAAANTEFIGLENLRQMLNDPRFVGSVGRTVNFLFWSAIIGQCLFGFTIAFLLRGKATWIKRLVGIAVITAWVTPEVVAGMNIVNFLGENGTVNVIRAFFGAESIAWTWEFPMFSIIMANIWRGTAFSMMVFQAALDDIPREVEEAAMMDGATNIGIVRRITIPMVRGTIGTNMMLVTLQTLGVFGLIFTMTGGGPGDATMTLPIFMYRQSFVAFQLGYGTAISLVLLLIGIIFSVGYMKALKMEV